MIFPEHVTIQRRPDYGGYVEMVKELAGEVQVPIGLHLNHEYHYAQALKAMNCGFLSVMLDGSMMNLRINIQLTKMVVEDAHKKGIIIEGEIGHAEAAPYLEERMKTLCRF